MSLIEAAGLCHAYRQGGLLARHRQPVLEGAAITVEAGECVALLGPTGSGKSTLGRVLLGLERPDAGTVRFDGTPLLDHHGRMPPARRRAIQAVFQDPAGATSPRLSVGEVVAEALLAERLPPAVLHARVGALLDQVGLDPAVAPRRAHGLSGGQLQRLCIARALAPSPRLVVLDEAVSSLDVETQARILALLRALRREAGLAYLFITHDLRLVRSFADRCYVMQDRRPVEVDDPLGSGPAPPNLVALRSAVLPSRPRSAPTSFPSRDEAENARPS